MINFNNNLTLLKNELKFLQMKIKNSSIVKKSILSLLKNIDASPLFFPLTLSKSKLNIISIDNYLSSLSTIELFPNNINSNELSRKIVNNSKDDITKKIIIKHNIELYEDDIKMNNYIICLSVGIIAVKDYKIKKINYLYKDKDDINPEIKYQADVIIKKEKVQNDYSKIYINNIKEVHNILKLVNKHIITYKKAYTNFRLPSKFKKMYDDRLLYIYDILNLLLLLVKRIIN
jgi:hypothetical protein